MCLLPANMITMHSNIYNNISIFVKKLQRKKDKKKFWTTTIFLQQFRNYYARYIEDTIMSILETWTLNDFAENQETLFNMMRVFLSGMNASPQALN